MKTKLKEKENSVYLVAGSTPWNKEVFKDHISQYPGRWYFISKREELTLIRVKKLSPRYIFFLHWSWIIPPEIYQNYECVVFHMTDLPFGRGGSPLQNLLIRGIYKTKISAIRVVGKLDAGPVYLKKPLSLQEGSAQALYTKASAIGGRMIKEIIRKHPQPKPQKGVPVLFRRRTPPESAIPPDCTPRALYDFIRMLDASGYPLAYIEQNGYRIEFRQAELRNNHVHAGVVITRNGTENTKSTSGRGAS